MAIRQGFYQGPGQRPQATAHLAQTMSLLGLNSQELIQKIEAALAENPALELVEGRYCPKCKRKLRNEAHCPVCSFQQAKEAVNEEPIVFLNSAEEGFGSRATSGSELREEIPTADKEPLAAYVLRQISSELASDEQEIAAHILTSINEDGILDGSLEEIARFYHRPLSDVEVVSELIQNADPLGVGSESSEKALLVQLKSLGDKVPHYDLSKQAILEGMEVLSKHQYGELGQMLNISRDQAKAIAEFIIENLNPFPGRSYWGTKRSLGTDTPSTLQKPDIIVRRQKNDKRLVVEVMWPLFGLLRVNPLFQDALKSAPEEKAEEWKIDLEQASLLIKCLAQRNHTIVRLMQIISVVQRNFILEGDAHMKPITRAKLAEELGVHESTVSRAVAGKSVQLPSGKIVMLSQFFDRSLHIRTELKSLIEEESKALSDTKLVKLLEEKGHKIARRTVAKYRNMEGILPAHMRKAQLAKT